MMKRFLLIILTVLICALVSCGGGVSDGSSYSPESSPIPSGDVSSSEGEKAPESVTDESETPVGSGMPSDTDVPSGDETSTGTREPSGKESMPDNQGGTDSEIPGKTESVPDSSEADSTAPDEDVDLPKVEF